MEQGLNATPAGFGSKRSADTLPRPQPSQKVLFCTVTALGLVRLVGQPKLMGAAVKTAGEASALLEAFCQQPGVSIAMPEQGGLGRVLPAAAHLCLPGRRGDGQWLAPGEFRSRF